MNGPIRFVIGGAVTVLGLAGLMLAAAAPEGVVYWGGLAVFAIALLVDLLLIGTARAAAPAGRMRDTGPLPVRMRTEHGLGAPPPPSPAMPAQGIAMRRPRSALWRVAAPWLRGGAFVVIALIALVVAATSAGLVMVAAFVAFALSTLTVFRHIAHGGRPPRLIPEFVPATPGGAFALGTLLGVVALISLVSAASGRGGGGVSITLAIVAVVAVFVLIAQWWDRAERRRGRAQPPAPTRYSETP